MRVYAYAAASELCLSEPSRNSIDTAEQYLFVGVAYFECEFTFIAER